MALKRQASAQFQVDREILNLALPAILSNMSTPLIGLVDSFVAGHLGAASLNAVAVGVNTFTLLYGIFVFLRKSTTGLTGQALGAKNYDEIRATAARSIGIGFLIGFCLILIKDQLMLLVFAWLSPPESAYGQCVEYYQARVLGAPFALANYAVQGFLSGMKRAKQVLCQQVVLNLANVILCILLASRIGPFQLGVSGIGYAASLANILAFLNGIYQVWVCLQGGLGSGKLPGAWSLSVIFSTEPLKKMAKLGGAVTLRSVCLTLTQTGFTAVASRLTTPEHPYLAGNLMLLQLHQLFTTGSDGFSNAAETLVAEAIGRKDPSRMYLVVKRTCLYGFGIALAFSVVWFSVGDLFFKAMTDAATRLEADEAGHYLLWVVIGCPIAVWAFLMDGFFVGGTLAAEMLYSMVFATSSYMVTIYILVGGDLDLPGFGPFPLALGNNGLWLGFYSFLAYRAVGLGMQWKGMDRACQPPDGYLAADC